MKIFDWLVPAWLQWGVVAAIAASIGWTAQGWHKDAEIADLKREQADIRATQAAGALNDLVAAASNINAAAKGYVDARDDLISAMSAITKDLKNVQKQNPLPVNCRPDAGRLRSFQAAVAAANAAAAGAGQQSGGTVPSHPGAAK